MRFRKALFPVVVLSFVSMGADCNGGGSPRQMRYGSHAIGIKKVQDGLEVRFIAAHGYVLRSTATRWKPLDGADAYVAYGDLERRWTSPAVSGATTRRESFDSGDTAEEGRCDRSFLIEASAVAESPERGDTVGFSEEFFVDVRCEGSFVFFTAYAVADAVGTGGGNGGG